MILLSALLLAAAPAPADPPATPEPQRYSTLVVFGSDPCPRSSENEVVVCARMPENERYRVPKRLRERRVTQGAPSVAWSRKVESMEYVSRMGIPNSCSVQGSFGAPALFADRIKAAGVPLICQVQTMAHVREAVAAGADIIVAQGSEAGSRDSGRSGAVD